MRENRKYGLMRGPGETHNREEPGSTLHVVIKHASRWGGRGSASDSNAGVRA
jgi:hypothetical protein